MFQLRFVPGLFTLFFALSSFAFPMPKAQYGQQLDFQVSAMSSYDFEGIVALSNCSGSLVRFETSKDTDPAMVFTNGHCLESGFSEPGEVVVHKPSTRTMALMDTQGMRIGSVHATEIIYSTMTNTDLTIYKLQETYQDILSKSHVRPLTLASHHPETAMPIEVISGYWKKGYSCSIETFIPALKEADWTFTDSIRYSRPGCETIGGTSGSPILLAGSRTMIGINNTGNEDGEKCTMNNPCEVDANGSIQYVKGYSYGQQTFWVYSCLNDHNELDLKKEGCALPH